MGAQERRERYRQFTENRVVVQRRDGHPPLRPLSALDEALALTEFVSKVIVFHRDAELDGQAVLRQRVQAHPKIELRPNTEVIALLGDGMLEAVSTRHTESSETSQVDLAGLFVFIGLEPNTSFLDGVVPLDGAGHVETDIWMRTPTKGHLRRRGHPPKLGRSPRIIRRRRRDRRKWPPNATSTVNTGRDRLANSR